MRGLNLLQRLLRWGFRQPTWLRPPLLGMAVVLALMIPRVLWSVPAVFSGEARPGELPIVLVIVAAAGFLGGLAYSTTRPALRRLGRAGDYLSGILLIDGYLGTFLLASPFVFQSSAVPDDTEGWLLWVALSSVLGVVAGHVFFGPQGVEAAGKERGKPQLSLLEREGDGARETAALVSGWIRACDLERLLALVADATATTLPAGEAARVQAALAQVDVESEEGVEARLAGPEPVLLHLVPDEEDPVLSFDVLLARRHCAGAEAVRARLETLTVDPLSVAG